MSVDLELLRKTIEELLCSRGVFDVDDFGWLNADDVDPEFVGYAMWALSPPYDHDFESWQNDTPPSRAPTEAEQRLMELGHDFFGLMKTARHFIGHALLNQPTVRPFGIEPTDFDFNEFAALTALTAAADRLRDFIIATTFGITPKKSSAKTWKEFNEACNKLRVSSFAVEADALQKGFKAIHDDARKARNEAVHGLATRPAHVQKDLITRDREAFEKQRWHDAGDREVPYEDMIREQKQFDAKELAEVEAHAKLLCDCHVKLVKMGEISFRTELYWRQARMAGP
jgi:hypothetical protein